MEVGYRDRGAGIADRAPGRHRSVESEAIRFPACGRSLLITASRRMSNNSRVSAASSFAISPDGTQTVHVASQRLWLRSISEFDGRAIPGVQMQGMHSPAFSPDGRSLVFYAETALRRISLLAARQ